MMPPSNTTFMKEQSLRGRAHLKAGVLKRGARPVDEAAWGRLLRLR
jgi:hypothetical protein